MLTLHYLLPSWSPGQEHTLTSQNCIPLTLLPQWSSGGDHRHMPITLGTTSRITPDTPDLAGKPTWERKSHKGWYMYTQTDRQTDRDIQKVGKRRHFLISKIIVRAKIPPGLAGKPTWDMERKTNVTERKNKEIERHKWKTGRGIPLM